MSNIDDVAINGQKMGRLEASNAKVRRNINSNEEDEKKNKLQQLLKKNKKAMPSKEKLQKQSPLKRMQDFKKANNSRLQQLLKKNKKAMPSKEKLQKQSPLKRMQHFKKANNRSNTQNKGSGKNTHLNAANMQPSHIESGIGNNAKTSTVAKSNTVNRTSLIKAAIKVIAHYASSVKTVGRAVSVKLSENMPPELRGVNLRIEKGPSGVYHINLSNFASKGQTEAVRLFVQNNGTGLFNAVNSESVNQGLQITVNGAEVFNRANNKVTKKDKAPQGGQHKQEGQNNGRK